MKPHQKTGGAVPGGRRPSIDLIKDFFPPNFAVPPPKTFWLPSRWIVDTAWDGAR
jgi:hypothetical protein